MSSISFEELGITKEDLIERLVDRLAGELNDDGYYGDRVDRRMSEMVKQKIDAAVTAIGEEHIAPRIKEMIEGVTLQATNQWGEPRGEALTFTEYLIQRAHRYMTEEVDFEGKTKEESSGYNWRKSGQRVHVLVDKHLQYEISTAMKAALVDVNSKIAAGLAATVKTQLAQVLEKLKTSVTT